MCTKGNKYPPSTESEQSWYKLRPKETGYDYGSEPSEKDRRRRRRGRRRRRRRRRRKRKKKKKKKENKYIVVVVLYHVHFKKKKEKKEEFRPCLLLKMVSWLVLCAFPSGVYFGRRIVERTVLV